MVRCRAHKSQAAQGRNTSRRVSKSMEQPESHPTEDLRLRMDAFSALQVTLDESYRLVTIAFTMCGAVSI